MKPALVSLAAGTSQLPLIAAARRRGLSVIGVDRDARAAGLVQCEAHVAASTHDATAVIAGLEALEGFRFDGVVARSSGPPVLTAALVAEHFGLAGVQVNAAHEAVSKSGQRLLASRAGLRVPEARTMAPGSAPETPGAPPWVVKPRVTRVGKMAIRRVEHAGGLATAVREAGTVSEDGCAEVETWVPGRDVVVAGVFQESRWIRYATFEEDTQFDDDFQAVGWGLSAPADLPNETERTLDESARSFVEKNELGDGVLFLTFRVPEFGQPTFLEAHLDLGGDYVVDALLSECELNDRALDLALRKPVKAPRMVVGPRVLRFLFDSDGGAKLGLLTAESPSAKVVLDRPGGEGPRARIGYFVESTEGPPDNRRWTERVHQLLER